jgi:hypothetical protein
MFFRVAVRCWGALPSLAWLALATVSAWGQSPVHRPHGSKDKPHWAFQPVVRPTLPTVRNPDWVRTPLDAFVLARFEAQGLQPAAPADRRTLLRRVYLDLIGLPPTPEEQRAFLADTSSDAYARVVNDLLARPQYGERWGRHWLDIVRYAESNGYERDGAKPSAWRYRDYVIEALNQDKPYDRFVTEQIAGDELPDTSAETQIATSFLRMGTWDDEPADPKVDRYDQLDDVLGTTATAFLGLTLRCARCHNHKFEPLTQEDYYSMLAVFEPLKRPRDERDELDWPVGTQAELALYREKIVKADAAVAAVRALIESQQKTIRDRLFVSPIEKTNQPAAPRTKLPPEVIAAFQVEPDKRTDQQKALVKKHTEQLNKEIRAAETAEEKALREQLEKSVAAIHTAQAREVTRAYVWYEDSPQATATHIFRRGDPTNVSDEVGPAVPAILVREQPAPPAPTATTTGRRLWLAHWLTAPDNPLTARVMVNRVWQHHFGEGLVGTPNDFGRMGDPPTDPELLDWLASEFMAGGWKLKTLHRLILLSNTYQMAATPSSGEGALPLGCRQRRLEAEPVRDSILAVSGHLNLQGGGPSIYPPIPRPVLEGQSRPGDGWGKSDDGQAARRSIYIFAKRSLAVPELDLLDAPDTTSSCEQRMVSTTGPQALTFLNGTFTHEQARYFAARLEREGGGNETVRVQRAFELALCRPARDEEVRAALEFLSAQQKQIEADASKVNRTIEARRKALEAFCLVLLNTNEFVYVD